MTKTGHGRMTLGAMYTGLGLTVVATILPYVDRVTTHLLADHIRAGYPSYTDARVDSAVTTYLVLLSVAGALGVLAWLWTIRAVKGRKRWARPVATALFVIGTGIALTGLLTRDTSGDTGLPTVLGLAGTAPSLAALVAVTLLWRRSRPV
ncbi:hypothetical protein [Streptomyces sp. NPDC048565]|uniref:hypothetical protein n=1 Tax=Streptomyces sp. NPDC048565 TaxID=3155266 RepID=UPI00342C6B28